MSFLFAGGGLLLAILAGILFGDIRVARWREARSNTLAFDMNENGL
jgi:hypothetical protein